MKNLILLGGGGHCRSIIDVAENTGYNILGILDLPTEVGKEICGYRILGTDDDICRFVGQAHFIITIGQIKNAFTRKILFQRIIDSGGILETLISPLAYVSKRSKIGRGTVVLNYANVNTSSCIGDNVILNSFSNIEHDTTIGNHCHISTGAIVNGGCKIGDEVFIGSQSVVNQNIHITNQVTISSGSLVKKNILSKGLYSGNPAKFIKEI